MSNVDPCFDTIIGLSRTLCECIDYLPADMISDSGLYLDELEPLNSTWIKSREDCEKGLLAEIMRNARSEASLMVKNDILEAMKGFFEVKRFPFKGSIGTLKYNTTITLSKNYSGLRIMGADINGGLLRIKNIRTIFEEDLIFDLYIYDNNNNLVETVLLSADANKLTSNVVDIELPLHYDYLDNVKYYFVYESAGKTPKNVGMGCTWCESSPCWVNHHKGWQSWVMASGYATDTLTDFIDDNICISDLCYSNGLILDVELICKADELICKDGFDFVGNPLAMSIAYATRWRAGINVIESLLGDTELNRLLMANRETLINFRQVYIENYQKKILYIAENIDISNNDCYQCFDAWGFKKETIIV